MVESVELTIPRSFPVFGNLFEKFTALNPGLEMHLEGNILQIKEKEIRFSEIDFFAIELPFWKTSPIWTYSTQPQGRNGS